MENNILGLNVNDIRDYILNVCIVLLFVSFIGYCEQSPAQQISSKSRKKYIYGFMDKTGKLVITPKFDDAFPFSEGLSAIKIDGKWGFIDKTGRMIIHPHFQEALDFNEGVAGARINDKWGFIDKSGKFIIDPLFHIVYSFSEGLAPVTIIKEEYSDNLQLRCGYIDKTGKFFIKPQFAWASEFSEGMARVYEYDKNDPNDFLYCYIEKKNRGIVRPQLKPNQAIYRAYDFSDGLACILVYDKYEPVNTLQGGCIDKTGKFIIKPKPNFFGIPYIRAVGFNFSEGLACVYNNGWKYIDRKGKPVIQIFCKWAHPFHDGLAKIKMSDGKCSYIDKKGKFIIPPQFDTAGMFSEGLAHVSIGNKHFFIDKNGKTAFECSFENLRRIGNFSEGLVLIVFCYSDSKETHK